MGNCAAGKTSLFDKFQKGTFSAQYNSTFGISVTVHPYTYESMNLKLEVWDSVSDDRFDTLAPLFFRNANGVLYVFDLSSKESFQSLETWAQTLKESVQELPS